ncbi:unnamed protein product [Lupinus luteus]|uniref:Uncharacterized protein n=1 Tax=Lupinus luteus TaxID=3873 RepID=A0AAV1VQQ3_LUPLU
MQQVEDYLDSIMESAMDEFRLFEQEFNMMSKTEMESLVESAESARKRGKLMEKNCFYCFQKVYRSCNELNHCFYEIILKRSQSTLSSEGSSFFFLESLYLT